MSRFPQGFVIGYKNYCVLFLTIKKQMRFVSFDSFGIVDLDIFHTKTIKPTTATFGKYEIFWSLFRSF